MPSFLQGQIDFLDAQLGSLQQNKHEPGDIEEAVELLLILYEQIRIAEQRGGGNQSSVAPLYDHWLRGTDQMIPLLRELKARGHRLARTAELMKACLRARAVSSRCFPRTTGRAVPLEEVQRELQGRA